MKVTIEVQKQPIRRVTNLSTVRTQQTFMMAVKLHEARLGQRWFQGQPMGIYETPGDKILTEALVEKTA
jgi:hypothetical protein